MKKICNLLIVLVSAMVLASCGNGSSGTAMLDLDVRICLNKDAQSRYDRSNPEEKQKIDDGMNYFSVLPGPYEFTWEELKNQDGSAGREQCATKLKIKLRLNKTLKPYIHTGWHDGQLYTDEEMMDKIQGTCGFQMVNSEGKTSSEDIDNTLLFLNPSLKTKWGADGKIGFTDNKDGVLDFYHFLTSEPGTEFDLILDCGIHLCKDIEDIIEFNKGLYIHPSFYE